ncbi:hypothetical protein [Bacillus sp. FJAT-28004]|uniref:hypothetical protein n=1 Tax=Bacillus sp. FJAT-28004 TaxID=1679165 RepID=UPI0006B5B31A|nr:hypothetical protein [Bacillus sp. FJAT-28004]
MLNGTTTIPRKNRRQKGFASFAAFGITMTLLAGCGQTGTSEMGAPPNPDSAAIAPANLDEETNAVSEADNPFAAAGINDPQAFIKMFEAAKAAVAADEKDAVAELVLLPLRVNGKTPMEITSKAEFIEKYDLIMTKSVKEALAAQKVEDLFVRDQGVMVGDGELWFGASAEEPQVYGIIAVNP